MTKEEFQAKIEKYSPNKYHFYTVEGWNAFLGCSLVTYAYRFDLFDLFGDIHRIYGLPPTSAQHMHMADYALVDGHVKKDRYYLFERSE